MIRSRSCRELGLCRLNCKKCTNGLFFNTYYKGTEGKAGPVKSNGIKENAGRVHVNSILHSSNWE